MSGCAAGAPDPRAIEAIVEGRHGDPFAILGPHKVAGGCAVRTFIPAARAVAVLAAGDGSVLAELSLVHDAGFWCGVIPKRVPYVLRVDFPAGAYETEDPYAFQPLLGELDTYLLAEGRHLDFSAVLGAHVDRIEGVAGVRFAVWAPNARRVSVVGNFNVWDGRRHPMRYRHGPGVWELFVPRIGPGEIYKYEIVGPDGVVLPLKADPVAQATECPPRTGSVVPPPWNFTWTDAAWMATRAERQGSDAPLSIYEMHAFSWRGEFLSNEKTWDDLADELIPYLLRMRFTHVELMPVMEFPFGGSWGYQVLGQFAPSARLGPPRGFASFVDRAHAAGIGVLLDWVPGHFPTDSHGMARFDGTALYEHADPREGFHRDWNTLIYNLGRNEVRSFLIGGALFWLEHFHVDGLRVDAVASMLYRNFSRPEGEWVPNKYGGRENLEAISFFHDLSHAVRARVPGAVLMAEESTDFPMVSRAVEHGGLGFDYKWNMGWMHDTLDYMAVDPIYRRWHSQGITFGMMYAYSERFVLALSHDEVVHLKRALVDKMPGDFWQKFANLRAYYGLMWTHPGKKLLFMGGEFAQWREWNHEAGLDWFLLSWPLHAGMQAWVADLNAAYRREPALHVRDEDPGGFRWVVLNDEAQSVFAYLRFGWPGDPPVLAVCNFTPVPRHGYRVGVSAPGVWEEILNSDSRLYGGSDVGNGGALVAEAVPSHGLPASLVLTVPPLGTILLRAAQAPA